MVIIGWVLINRDGKRFRDDSGKCLPYFQYLAGAIKYVIKRLNNSPAVTIHPTNRRKQDE